MIKHTDIPSNKFTPAKELIMVFPRELPKGEVEKDGLIIEMEQNTSVVDRPTLGKIIAVGTDVKDYEVGQTLIWEERAGQDVILEDGQFLLIGSEAVLGIVKID